MSRNFFTGFEEGKGSCKDLVTEELEEFVGMLGVIDERVEEKCRKGKEEVGKVVREIGKVEKEIEDKMEVLRGRKELVEELGGLLERIDEIEDFECILDILALAEFTDGNRVVREIFEINKMIHKRISDIHKINENHLRKESEFQQMLKICENSEKDMKTLNETENDLDEIIDSYNCYLTQNSLKKPEVFRILIKNEFDKISKQEKIKVICCIKSINNNQNENLNYDIIENQIKIRKSSKQLEFQFNKIINDYSELKNDLIDLLPSLIYGNNICIFNFNHLKSKGSCFIESSGYKGFQFLIETSMIFFCHMIEILESYFWEITSDFQYFQITNDSIIDLLANNSQIENISSCSKQVFTIDIIQKILSNSSNINSKSLQDSHTILSLQLNSKYQSIQYKGNLSFINLAEFDMINNSNETQTQELSSFNYLIQSLSKRSNSINFNYSSFLFKTE